jgi:hypothetical protein
VWLCLEEMEQDFPGEAVKEQDEVQVKGLEGLAGWAAAVREQGPAGTVLAQAAARRYRISAVCRATT